VNFGRYNFAELFTHHIRKFCPIMTDYFNLVHELIGPLNESKFSRDELKSTGVIDYWIEMTLLKGDTTGGSIDTTKNDRESAICKKFAFLHYLIRPTLYFMDFVSREI
jgi:hypothetical protein